MTRAHPIATCVRFHARFLLGAAVLVFALAATAQDLPDFSKVQIQTIPVADGVHMLVGQGGNIGVSHGSDGVVVIDDQFAPLHEKIVAAVTAIQAGGVRFVLNTHWHFDHTGGNEAMGKAGALIVAHDAVRTRMSVEQVMGMMERTVPAAPPEALPVVTFGADTTLHVNGDALHVVHLPNAHTDGDAIVHFTKANVIHTGDLFFNGRYPFVDLDSGGSIDGLVDAIDFLLDLANEGTKIIPGHGALADRAALADYRSVIAAARDRVASAIAEGESADEVVAANLLADFDAEGWSQGFMTSENFVRIVHASLSAR